MLAPQIRIMSIGDIDIDIGVFVGTGVCWCGIEEGLGIEI
jgi:hypothetical protein